MCGFVDDDDDDDDDEEGDEDEEEYDDEEDEDGVDDEEVGLDYLQKDDIEVSYHTKRPPIQFVSTCISVPIAPWAERTVQTG